MKLSRAAAAQAAMLLASFAAAEDYRIQAGASRFTYRDGDSRTRVWVYRPAEHGRDDPVLFVMHGTKRNADSYRDAWIDEADRLGILLLTPEFTKEAFPTGWGYQQLGVLDGSGARRPIKSWACENVEAIFDAVVRDNRLSATSYYLYGHSAGGQFVHRMMLLKPNARVALALPANPGWYTLAALDKDYPEGLRRTPVRKPGLRQSLANNVVLLLGDADTDTNGKNLPRGDAAKRQGPHRFARGKHFYAGLQALAEQENWPMRWKIEVVPGVGHSNRAMAPAAAKVIERHIEATRQAKAPTGRRRVQEASR